MSEHQSTSAETSMDNSTILWNSSKLEAIFPTQTISFWEIMLIEDTTQSKQSASFSPLKLDTNKDSLSSEEIINQEASLKHMDSMMNA